jgi:hypothetical protein
VAGGEGGDVTRVPAAGRRIVVAQEGADRLGEAQQAGDALVADWRGGGTQHPLALVGGDEAA